MDKKESGDLKRPSQEEQLKVFSNLFEAFKSIKLDWKSKYAGFERVLLDSKLVDHWVIVGISHDALELIANNGFSKTNKGVVRGHITNRKDRAEYLFSHDFKSSEDAYRYFMDLDKVILITKNENSIKKGLDDWSKTYEIDPEIFPYRCGFSTKYTEEALIYLKRLYEEKTK